MSFKDIRNDLSPEVNALLEDMVEFDEINKPMHYNEGEGIGRGFVLMVCMYTG